MRPRVKCTAGTHYVYVSFLSIYSLGQLNITKPLDMANSSNWKRHFISNSWVLTFQLENKINFVENAWMRSLLMPGSSHWVAWSRGKWCKLEKGKPRNSCLTRAPVNCVNCLPFIQSFTHSFLSEVFYWVLPSCQILQFTNMNELTYKEFAF